MSDNPPDFANLDPDDLPLLAQLFEREAQKSRELAQELRLHHSTRLEHARLPLTEAAAYREQLTALEASALDDEAEAKRLFARRDALRSLQPAVPPFEPATVAAALGLGATVVGTVGAVMREKMRQTAHTLRTKIMEEHETERERIRSQFGLEPRAPRDASAGEQPDEPIQ